MKNPSPLSAERLDDLERRNQIAVDEDHWHAPGMPTDDLAALLAEVRAHRAQTAVGAAAPAPASTADTVPTVPVKTLPGTRVSDAGDAEIDAKRHLQLTHLAMVYGFNEMAKEAHTLGEKIYYRMAGNAALQQFRDLGGQMKVHENQTVLTLPGGPPSIAFTDKDLALMRAALHDWDMAHIPRCRRCGRECLDGQDYCGAACSEQRKTPSTCEMIETFHDSTQQECGKPARWRLDNRLACDICAQTNQPLKEHYHVVVDLQTLPSENEIRGKGTGT